MEVTKKENKSESPARSYHTSFHLIMLTFVSYVVTCRRGDQGNYRTYRTTICERSPARAIRLKRCGPVTPVIVNETKDFISAALLGDWCGILSQSITERVKPSSKIDAEETGI